MASFRSPVTTLNTYLPPSRRESPLTHDDFSTAIVDEFNTVYGEKGREIEVTTVNEEDTRGAEKSHEKIWKGVEELKSWEWTYGQTPEFENTLEAELSFGKVVSVRHT